jgi:hypothetical protein
MHLSSAEAVFHRWHALLVSHEPPFIVARKNSTSTIRPIPEYAKQVADERV